MLIPEWIDNPETKVDTPGVQFYGHYVFNYGSLYLCLLEIMYGDHEWMNIQLASSRDLKDWNRLAAPEPFIKLGKKDSWDSARIQFSAAVPPLYDNKLWFYYRGSSRHGGGRHGGGGRFGVATLPKDRFAAILVDDKSQDGVLTTVPLRLAGDTIHINADAAEGMVQLELLDESGKVIEGFGRADCEALTLADSFDFAVRWKSGAALPKKPVRIRFVIFESELYSFLVK